MQAVLDCFPSKGTIDWKSSQGWSLKGSKENEVRNGLSSAHTADWTGQPGWRFLCRRSCGFYSSCSVCRRCYASRPTLSMPAAISCSGVRYVCAICPV